MVKEPQDANPITTFLQTLKVGFETTTRHPWLLMLPLFIDVLYWLGPRLRVTKLAEPGIEWWLLQLETVPNASQMVPPEFAETIVEVVERTNLMTQLTLPAVGVPALLNTLSPLATPIEAAAISIEDAGALVANYILISLLGMVVSAAYFSLVAVVVRDGEIDWLGFGRNLLPNTFKIFGLFLCFVIIFFLIGFPLVVLASLVGLIFPALSIVVIFGGSLLFIWAFVYLSFSIPALFFDKKGFFSACLQSMRFVQTNMRFALPLLLGIMLINQLTNGLWLRADDGSWLTLISLMGHAFIATATVVALFIFYRDHANIQPVLTTTEALLNQEI